MSLSNEISLTPSQEDVVNTCIKLFSVFKAIMIKGDSATGKYTVAKEIFKRLNATVEYFDIYELSKYTNKTISNQELTKYFNTLLERLNSRMNKSEFNHYEIGTIKREKIGIIYIRDYNIIFDTFTDCYSKLRFLLTLVIKLFIERIPNDIRILITCSGYCNLTDEIHWCVELKTTREDMEHVLMPFLRRGDISGIEFQNIMKISKIVPVGRILYCIKYALIMCKGVSDEERDKFSFKDGSTNKFIEYYKKALSKFSGSTVNIKDVSKPIPEDELIGVEDILEEITVSIINPMELNIPNVPIKKGLILCGPPGTGKTSIGRWLAHKIKGKFYLVGNEMLGRCIIDAFQTAVKKANENAPAVVFIDDGDILFENDDTYRAFLTILDGIENNKRNDVCVILTCMNMKNIPSSLLRGGRLEMVLITQLPDKNKISIVLEKSLRKMQKTLDEFNKELSESVSKYITKEFISNISLKMIGWNYADINRCVNDVIRLIISKKESNLSKLFDKCIKQIKEQYELCSRCEFTNLDNKPYNSYII